MYLILRSRQRASLEASGQTRMGHWIHLKWTVDKRECTCTVGLIGHMMEKLEGYGWTTLAGQWKPKICRP